VTHDHEQEYDDITGWIGKLKQGDARAAQAIWEQYFDKLVRLARRKTSPSAPSTVSTSGRSKTVLPGSTIATIFGSCW
jgi:hypothetical protein